jgi:hypothetical protein
MKRRTKSDKVPTDDNSGVVSKNTPSSESLPKRSTSTHKPIVNTNAPRKKTNHTPALVVLGLAFAAIAFILYRFYARYGINIILGHSWRDYTWTPYQWRSFIDENNKTILLIGGPHRSGTTLIWNAITSHPDIVGFGDTRETGVDYSEGVLFQDVYPRFGVGLEYQHGSKGNTANKFGGLGQYALLPEETVHWTRENKRNISTHPQTLSRLLNRFAPYWDQNKKFPAKNGLKQARVYVEKSPQNAVLSLFLEGVYNMPISSNGTYIPNDALPTTNSRKSVTKFLFITRHPLANSYAHDSFLRDFMGYFLPFETYLKNYIQLHRYMKMDSAKLESEYMFVKLEDFAQQPYEILRNIFVFLGVETDLDATTRQILSQFSIDADPNRKYRDKWCSQGIKEHHALVSKYDGDILELSLGYDLASWCLKDLS